MEKTFVNSYKTSKFTKVFLPQKFPAYTAYPELYAKDSTATTQQPNISSDRTKGKRGLTGSRPLCTKNASTKTLHGTTGAFMHKYNKAAVNTLN